MTGLLSKKSRPVTLADLKTLPLPASRGPWHAPVPHHLLVDSIEVEARERGHHVMRTQLALNRDGSKLFGVINLASQHEDRSLALGFRNSTNSTMSIKLVAGTNVFVCDNMALSGDMIALARRNTTGLDIEEALAVGFDRFSQHATVLDQHIMRLQAHAITDVEAKAQIVDAFTADVLPVRYFDDVVSFYFEPATEATDCQPRTLWGLHNAFTRAMKALEPPRRFSATVALGELFGLVTR